MTSTIALIVVYVPAYGFVLDAASSYLPPKILYFLVHLAYKIRHIPAEYFFDLNYSEKLYCYAYIRRFCRFWVLLTMALHELTLVVVADHTIYRVFVL